MNLPLTVEEVAYHRNGVGGAPFYVVTFTYEDRPMVGIVFTHAEHHVAVFDRALLGQGAIAFGGTEAPRNSWRGDWFEFDLRDAIAAHNRDEDLRYAALDATPVDTAAEDEGF